MHFIDPHDWCPACEQKVTHWIRRSAGFGEGSSRVDSHCPTCDRLAPKHQDIYFFIPGLALGLGATYGVSHLLQGDSSADELRSNYLVAWISLLGGFVLGAVFVLARRQWIYRRRPADNASVK